VRCYKHGARIGHFSFLCITIILRASERARERGREWDRESREREREREKKSKRESERERGRERDRDQIMQHSVMAYYSAWPTTMQCPAWQQARKERYGEQIRGELESLTYDAGIVALNRLFEALNDQLPGSSSLNDDS
jgi:hypothetical protein